MRRALLFCCLLALLAALPWALRERGPERRPAARPGAPTAAPFAGSAALAAPSAALDAAPASGTVARTDASDATQGLLLGAQRVRVVCSRSGKGVPAFELELECRGRSARVTTDLQGWARLPVFCESAGTGVRPASDVWGYREARLALPGCSPDAGGTLWPKAPLADAVLAFGGPGFLLIDLPGAWLEAGFAPYGDFGHRELLGPELVLALQQAGPADAEGERIEFELRGNGRQWSATGSYERAGGSIRTERVALEPVPTSRVDVALVDANGAPVTGQMRSRIRLRHQRSGVEQVSDAKGQRAMFRSLEPGDYVIGGIANGLRYETRTLALEPFEHRRMELPCFPSSERGRRLEVRFSLKGRQDYTLEQLPVSAVVERERTLWDETPEAPTPPGQVRWQGGPGSWQGEVVFEDLATGRYVVELGGVLAPRALMERALAAAGFDASLDSAARAAEARSQRGEGFWVERDTTVERTVGFTTPGVIELRFEGDTEREEFAAAATRTAWMLGAARPLAQRIQSGQSIGVYLESENRWRDGDGGLLGLALPPGSLNEIDVHFSALGERRELEPGWAARAYRLTFGEGRSLRQALLQGYLGD